MTYNEKEKQRTMAYARDKIKRIPLDVQISDYEQIKAAADQCGEKVNTFIKRAIKYRIATMEFK